MARSTSYGTHNAASLESVAKSLEGIAKSLREQVISSLIDNNIESISVANEESKERALVSLPRFVTSGQKAIHDHLKKMAADVGTPAKKSPKPKK